MKHEYSTRHTMRDDFRLYVSETKSRIDSELRKLCLKLSGSNLHPLIEHAVLSQGKRLRPLLVVLSAQSVGANPDRVMSLAMAFELIHTATLVHDDIIDQDDTRRDRPAVHKKWSVNDAILTGDALIALSVDLASGYGQTVLRTVAQSALELCEGEHADITLAFENVTEDSYFRRIREKSASLFRAASYCGALAGGGTPAEVLALSTFGENFGIAYQIRDDILDLTQKGRPVLKDLKRERVTLPLIHAYMSGSPQQRNQLERQIKIAMNEGSDDTVTSNLLQTINQIGAIDYCEMKIDEHLRQAVDSVSSLRDSKCKAYLVEMTHALKIMR